MDLEGYESGTEILIHLISFNINEVEISSMKKGNAINYIGVFTESMGYAPHGNITKLRRRGLVDNLYGTFGLVDDLSMTYVGNMLASVRDNASRHSYAGATDFDGVPGQEYHLTYNASGSLVSDAGRGIARIDYDRLNNPVRIQFTDGSVTRYIYSTTGEKLRVVYQTAVPNITVPIGSVRELLPSEIQCADSTDYRLGGSLTLRNGRVDKLQFEEGYCQAAAYSGNASQDNFTFHYYDRDHLGNIRQVIKATGSNKGTVIQTMDYYPFGAEFCDGSTDSEVQSRKYNGKEFDKMHGLNTYDYGARQYNPVTARWDRVDPLSEKYYDVSPYAYCGNNPVRYFDPDGREIQGQTKKDTKQVIEDIKAMFAAEVFSNFRNLIIQSGKRQNGISLAKIDENALKTAFDGINLSEDQQALVEIVVNTINSDDIHKIEYASEYGVVSDDAKAAYDPLPIFDELIENEGGMPTRLIISSGGGGVTMPTSSGTHSVIVNSKKYHPVGRPVTTGHEIFGHGRSLALGRTTSQHVDSIQAENLIRRVMNINLINDGSNHGNKSYIPNPTSLPSYR